MRRLHRLVLVVFSAAALSSAGTAEADTSIPGKFCSPEVAAGGTYHWEEIAGPNIPPSFTVQCGGYQCDRPQAPAGPTFEIFDAGCDPQLEPCRIQLRVPLEFPGHQYNIEDGGYLREVRWFAQPTPPVCSHPFDCGQASTCGKNSVFGIGLLTDRAVFTATRTQSCNDIRGESLPLSLTAWACVSLSCRQKLDVSNLDFAGPDAAEAMGCPPPPPPERCKGDASCQSCPGGIGIGGGGAAAGGAGGGPGDPRSGPGAYLYYTAGGTGAAGLPGSTAWNATLGRHWSHRYAQRIVEDPLDPSDPPESHVWLITEYGTFREYGGLVGSTYTSVAPSDEYRTLEWSAVGWTLTDLDGTVTEFDASGLWLSTTDRNGIATTAVYDAGGLAEVHFPDQRRELFAYYEAPDPAEGKLESITEVGVDGVTTREWRYAWSGDDLVRVERPDGTAVEYFYEDLDFPGFLTRIELVGTDGTSRRVESAWQYDEDGRVAQVWSGDASPTGPGAVDRWQYSYDSETQTTVTDPLGQEIVYTYDRDPASRKVRVQEIAGDCPSCGLGPNAQLTYGDAANPLSPTSVVDGNGNQTTFTYDGNGQVLTRTEAATTGIARTTTNEYDPNYPALVTERSMPSVEAGQERLTLFGRDGQGNVTSQEVRGWEDGQPFDCTLGGGAPCYETMMTYNPAGQPLAVDPPGYGIDDVTSYTYDPARGSLVADSRTDPLIGTTTFAHDAYNRRTSTTDSNGVVTETEYDLLDRVTRMIQKGAGPAEDLVTEHVYDALGNLQRTILPAGNVIEYSYDAAGRLTTIDRKPDAATPAERTVYTLDDAGNRTREDLQRWTGSEWVTDSTTSYLYTTRCQLDQVLHPDGSITEHAYDCNGNLERTWDANHPSAGQTVPPTAEYAYDELDRLVTVTRPWAGAGGGTSVTTYDYDVQDHLVSVLDAEGNETTYDYSDRDLLTEEVSPVSGTTTHLYNAHGELVQTTDARGISELRSLDALDRVFFVDYPDATLDTSYTYDDPLVPFSLGRVTAITRDGHTVAYAYDRFGRTTQDGGLTYGYDANGNRTAIGYPGGVMATYGYDFADRETTLTVTTPAGSTPVVTSASYFPSGPLTELTFGTGAVESHAYDTRYLPAAIALDAAADRTWVYTNDDVGNVTEIMQMAACPGNLVLTNHTVMDGEEIFESCAALEAGPDFTVEAGAEATLRAATRVVLHDGFAVLSGGRLTVEIDPTLTGNVTRTYGYQDVDYFLTSAAGPWGTQSWTYDRIGSRLTETDDGATDTYLYAQNGTDGNTALLTSVQLAPLGTRTYAYTPAGHVDAVTAGANVVDFTWDDAGRLTQAERASASVASPFRYDGRGFLRTAGEAASAGTVTPTYDSSGLLHALLREPAGGPARRYHVFYLAGRPVAQLATETGQPDRWWYLTTDHLGTPLVATDAAGAELWENRFEPFGTDPWAGTSAGALANEMYLRFPGQWENEVWQEAMLGAEGYYNLNRWYSPGIGRFGRTDPLGLQGAVNLYAYANANPINFLDPLGLTSYEGFEPEDEAILKEGVEEAKRKLMEDCAGCSSATLLELLEKATFVADDSLLTRRFFAGCAEVTFWGFVTNTIKIDPRALTDPGYSQQCCAPAGLIVHEVTHLTLAGKVGEGAALENQHLCFGCEQMVIMQEYLERKRENRRPPGSVFGGP